MTMSSYLLGSQHNAVSAISPATTKMILKTVRDSKTSQDIHINAIYCSSKSIRFTFNSILKIIAIGFALVRLLSSIFVCKKYILFLYIYTVLKKRGFLSFLFSNGLKQHPTISKNIKIDNKYSFVVQTLYFI